jgi:hypothetical protein
MVHDEFNFKAKEDPVVPMALVIDYESIKGQDWDAKQFKANLPTPTVDFFTIIREAEYGLPISDLKRCEDWLTIQTVRHYGLDPLGISIQLSYEIHQIAECLVVEARNAAKKKPNTMVTPENIRYRVIDRPLLWYLYKCTRDSELPFLLCINSMVQDFIGLDVREKAICHRRAYEFSTIQNQEYRVNPRLGERAFLFKREGRLFKMGVHEPVEVMLANKESESARLERKLMNKDSDFVNL